MRKHSSIPMETGSLLKIAEPVTADNGKEKWAEIKRILESFAAGQYNFKELDEKGQTLLHYACRRYEMDEAEEAARLVLDWVKGFPLSDRERIDFVNTADKDGNIALQLATERRNRLLVKLLIENGSDIYKLKTSEHTDAVKMIYDKVLIEIFDNALTIAKYAKDKENEAVWQIECDFASITGLHNPSPTYRDDIHMPLNQTSHLARILRRKTATRGPILQHPLVQIFLYLKGQKFNKLLYFSMLYHTIWSVISFAFILCNTHIVESTNVNNSARDSNLTSMCNSFRIYPEGSTTFFTSAWFYFVTILFGVAIIIEIIEQYTCKDKWYYYKQLENMGQLVVLAVIFIVWVVAVVEGPGEKTSEDFSTFLWKNFLPVIYVAGMFASVLLVQGQLAKFKILSIYNQMFATGFLNVLKFILSFLPFLFAFLVTFHLLLPMRREFVPSWGLGFGKIFAMMTGEVGHGDIFYDEDEEEIAFKNTLKIVFIVFVVTVVILLQNLLIGVTVSDVQKLEAEAKVNTLASALEDIYLIENVVTSSIFVKLLKVFNIEESIRRHLIVDKSDSQIERLASHEQPGRMLYSNHNEKQALVNKMLDEYPSDLRHVLIQFEKDRQQKRKEEKEREAEEEGEHDVVYHH